VPILSETVHSRSQLIAENKMRKSALTPTKIEQLAKHMRMGLPMKVIFDACQVSSSSYYRWMGIGRALAEDDLEHPNIPEPPKRRKGESCRKFKRRLCRYEEELQFYETLYDTMQKAAAICRIEMVAVIWRAAMGDDPRAAVAFLERRDPDNWLPTQILRNLTTGEIHHQHRYSIMAPDMLELMRLLGQHERALSNELDDNIRAGTRNSGNSQPKDQ